ncbi:hypothetical protein CYMTET_6486 [Cymbomonas tetramitiformis]|uniref:SMP-30/Gluconolactonase/LRE-like region domain-containing protein n=1 Tax=Cymbomonas tetramitiformis TaxID=36881 RepID=A0AAE0GWZ4_9CHLO|nr:hypothetical protein CYMTET_6486 [Cymbomonas tetramitiformis]
MVEVIESTDTTSLEVKFSAVLGPVHELVGQTLQGALSSYSGKSDLYASAATSRFFSPYGVAVSSSGTTVYVGEAYKNRIRAVDITTGSISTVAGGSRGFQNGAASSARFSWPYGVAVSPDGKKLYVADSGNDCIRSVQLQTGMVSTIAGSGTRGYQDGSASSARFSWPYGVAVSPDGTKLYVADSGNNRVRSVDLATGEVKTLAGMGTAGYQDGPAGKARFYGPRGVVVSPDGGRVYVADYSNFRVRAIDLSVGTVFTLFGGGDSGQFYRPAGVAVTPDGTRVLAADSANSRVRTVDVQPALSPTVEFAAAPTPGTTAPVPPSAPMQNQSAPVAQPGYWEGRDDALDINPFKRQDHYAELDPEEVKWRRILILVIVLVILGLFAVVSVVAGALWQRRNALLMLKLYQSSNSQRLPEALSPVPDNTQLGDCQATGASPYFRRGANAGPQPEHRVQLGAAGLYRNCSRRTNIGDSVGVRRTGSASNVVDTDPDRSAAWQEV